MSFFSRLSDSLKKTRETVSSRISEVFASFKSPDENFLEELTEALILADTGAATAEKIVDGLREKIKKNKISSTDEIKSALTEEIAEIFKACHQPLHFEKENGNPAVILVIGVNGVGKTTTVGKLAHRLISNGKKVVIAAADTFRAAAVSQLEIWAERAGADFVEGSDGADPASVVFEALAKAKKQDADVLIIDTAGRLHNKKNLMDELKKIVRIIRRETSGITLESLLVLDAATGQNAVTQAKLFSETAEITGIILTKLDGTAKGGAVVGLAGSLKIPVKLIGLGEKIDDLQEFSPEEFARALFEEYEKP